MRWACFLNLRRYPVLERMFEGIVSNRVNTLFAWTKQQWELLDELSYTVVQACLTALRLHGLAGQFQVTQV